MSSEQLPMEPFDRVTFSSKTSHDFYQLGVFRSYHVITPPPTHPPSSSSSSSATSSAWRVLKPTQFFHSLVISSDLISSTTTSRGASLRFVQPFGILSGCLGDSSSSIQQLNSKPSSINKLTFETKKIKSNQNRNKKINSLSHYQLRPDVINRPLLLRSPPPLPPLCSVFCHFCYSADVSLRLCWNASCEMATTRWEIGRKEMGRCLGSSFCNL